MPDVGRCLPGAVVLETTVDVVRHVIVDIDVVELADRKVSDKGPGLASVAADVDAPVVSVEDEIGILGVLVPGVVVRVCSAVREDHLERPASVCALADHAVQVEQAIRVLRVRMNLRIVERAVADVLGRHQVPFHAPIRGFVQSGLLGLDQGIHDVWVCRAHGEAHAAQLSSGQSFIFPKSGPVVPAIVGDIQATALSTGGEEPRLPVKGPHGRKQLVGIARIQDHLGAASRVIDRQDVVPGFSAIPGPEDPALRVGAPG